jgi:hypothetical protein
MRDEPLRRQLGTVEVADCKSRSSDVDLAGHPGRHRLAVRVEKINVGVRDRPPDRDRRRSGVDAAYLVPRRETSSSPSGR